MPLKTLCRYCNVPLVLSGGDLLKASCPQCKRSLVLAVSIKTWPGLTKPEGGCVHFTDDDNCESCNTSRTLRKSLIDLELPTLKKMGNRPNNNNTLFFHEISQAPQAGFQRLTPEEDADYQERVDEYYQYVRDFNTILTENSREGFEDDIDPNKDPNDDD
jgi:hypothetical protein